MQTPAKEAKRTEQPKQQLQQQQAVVNQYDEEVDQATEIAYLEAAGWRFVRLGESNNPKKRWLDPQTGKPDRSVKVQEAIRDLAGRIVQDAIYQTRCGIPPWYYNRKEAVQIQRDRDEAKKKGK